MDRENLPDKLKIKLLELQIEELNALNDVSNRYASYSMIEAEQDRLREHYRQLERKTIEDFNNA